ncbi:hypothetical protein [Bradyrhizobium sp. USDA 4506]
MFSHLGAKLAAVANWLGRRAQSILLSRLTAVIVAAAPLAGCMADGRPVAVAGDPADSSTGRAGVGYRSTIAPYSSLRPATPLPWRERNDGVTPPAKSEH